MLLSLLALLAEVHLLGKACRMKKAKELATLPHPFYANTKKTAQEDVRQKISDAIEKYENLTGLNK